MKIQIKKYGWEDWTMLSLSAFAFILAFFNSDNYLYVAVIMMSLVVILKNIRFVNYAKGEEK